MVENVRTLSSTAFKRLGAIPYLLLGVGLVVLGILALSHISNNFFPFHVERLDLLRATALDQIDAPAILEGAVTEFILAFLAAVLLAVTGLALPLVYYLNRRFASAGGHPRFLLVLRQSMWLGTWVAFCVWLQMNRVLGPAVALLVAIVLALFEVLLQVRTRAVRSIS